jgi:hypothetical protein
VLCVSAIADITLNAGDGGNNDGDQEFRFTSVPEYGSSDNLQGNIGAYDPAEHKVAVYIKVAGGLNPLLLHL